MKRRRLITFIATLAALIVAATAVAYWTTSGSGNASATAATLNAPTNVTASSSFSTVSVSWTGSTLSNGTPAQGYYVTRTNTSTSATSAACGSSSSSLISGTSCSDTSVPDGTYTYKVTAVYHTWTAVSAASSQVTVVGDNTPPTVQSINRHTSSPTNASSVQFDVTFSESVTGVGSGDFALATTGSVSGASISSALGSGASYTVTVNTGTGSGTLGLNLVDDDSIQDAAGNKLGGTGTGNGNFTGQNYAIDRTTPTVQSVDRHSSSPTNGSSVQWDVTFTESVTGVDTSDFALATTGSVTGASIATVSGSGANYTVTVNTGSGEGTLGLNLVDNDSIVDGVGNKLGGTGAGNGNFTGQTYTIDRTAPTLSTLQEFDTDHNGKVDQVKATFNESLNTSYSAPNTVWTLANAPGGGSNTIVTNGVSISGSTATITLNEGTVNTAAGVYSGTTLSAFTIALASNANGVRDAAGNTASFSSTSVTDKANPVPTTLTFTTSSPANTPSEDDTISMAFSEPLAVSTLCSTWSGNTADQTNLDANGAPVTLRIVNNGAPSTSNDLFQVQSITGGSCATFSFGTVDLGSQGYVSADRDFTGGGSNASMIRWTFSSRTLRFNLGAASGSTAAVTTNPTAVYTPGSAITDIPGNAVTGTASHTGNHF